MLAALGAAAVAAKRYGPALRKSSYGIAVQQKLHELKHRRSTKR